MKKIEKVLKKVLNTEIGTANFFFIGVNFLYSIVGVAFSFLLGPLGFLIPCLLGLSISTFCTAPEYIKYIKTKTFKTTENEEKKESGIKIEQDNFKELSDKTVTNTQSFLKKQEANQNISLEKKYDDQYNELPNEKEQNNKQNKVMIKK